MYHVACAFKLYNPLRAQGSPSSLLLNSTSNIRTCMPPPNLHEQSLITKDRVTTPTPSSTSNTPTDVRTQPPLRNQTPKKPNRHIWLRRKNHSSRESSHAHQPPKKNPSMSILSRRQVRRQPMKIKTRMEVTKLQETAAKCTFECVPIHLRMSMMAMAVMMPTVILGLGRDGATPARLHPLVIAICRTGAAAIVIVVDRFAP